MYHSWKLLYLLATIPVLQRHSKFEGIYGSNYSLIIEKGLFIEWMAATGITNQLNTFENGDDCKCLFQRNTVLPFRSLQVVS